MSERLRSSKGERHDVQARTDPQTPRRPAGQLGSIGVRFMIDGSESGGGFSLVGHPCPAGTGRPAAPAQPGRRVQLRARRPRGRPPRRQGGVRRARRPGVQAARAVAHLLERRRHPSPHPRTHLPRRLRGLLPRAGRDAAPAAPTGPERAALASRSAWTWTQPASPASPPNTASSSAPRPPPQQRSALQHDGRSQQLRVPSVGQVPGRVFAAMRCTWTRRSGPLPGCWTALAPPRTCSSSLRSSSFGRLGLGRANLSQPMGNLAGETTTSLASRRAWNHPIRAAPVLHPQPQS